MIYFLYIGLYLQKGIEFDYILSTWFPVSSMGTRLPVKLCPVLDAGTEPCQKLRFQTKFGNELIMLRFTNIKLLAILRCFDVIQSLSFYLILQGIQGNSILVSFGVLLPVFMIRYDISTT
jgi:hypothetical protein